MNKFIASGTVEYNWSIEICADNVDDAEVIAKERIEDDCHRYLCSMVDNPNIDDVEAVTDE